MALSWRSDPEEKDHKRIKDIVDIKAPGDKVKQEKLARHQAKVITDPYKALRRARAALDRKEYDLTKIFLQRVIELDYERILDTQDKAALADISFAYDMGLFF